MSLVNFLEEASSCKACDVALGIENGIPMKIVDMISLIFKVIRWGVPVILIIIGSTDLIRAITQQKEEDIKKTQRALVTKFIYAGIVMVMPSLVKTFMSLFGGNVDNIWGCITALFDNCKK